VFGHDEIYLNGNVLEGNKIIFIFNYSESDARIEDSHDFLVFGIFLRISIQFIFSNILFIASELDIVKK
jgi:hypothetical protein